VIAGRASSRTLSLLGVLALALVFAGVSAQAAPAAAVWTTPSTWAGPLPTPEGFICLPVCEHTAVLRPLSGMDARGDAIAVYRSYDGTSTTLTAITHMRDGATFSQVLAPAGVVSAQLAVSPAGQVAVTWSSSGEHLTLGSATGAIGGTLTEGPALAVELLGEPSLAINDHGEAWLAWQQALAGNVQILASHRVPGGAFGAPQTIRTVSGAHEYLATPSVAVAPSGEAVLAYQETTEAVLAEELLVRIALAPPGGSFGASSTLPGSQGKPAPHDAEGGESPNVAIDSSGNALVLFDFALQHESTLTRMLKYSTRPSGGEFSPAPTTIPLGDPTGGSFQSSTQLFASDPQGDAVAVYDSAFYGGLAVVRRPAGGTFAAGGRVTDLGFAELEGATQVAIGGTGTAAIVWARASGDVAAQLVPISGPPEGAVTLAAADGALAPTVAMDGAGDGLAAWDSFDKLNDHLRVAGLESSAPQLESFTVPATAVAGQTVSFGAVASAVAGPDTYSWSFGDGTSGGGESASHSYAAAGAHTVTLIVSNLAGSTSDTATIDVAAAAAAQGGPSTARPVVTGARETHPSWREGNELATFASRRKAPIGTTFTFDLNEQASVSLAFTQPSAGRTVGRRCVAPAKGNRHKRACRLTVTRASLHFAGHTGLNKVAFDGRVSVKKKLPPGRYGLIITAANGAGTSAPASLSFTIIGR